MSNVVYVHGVIPSIGKRISKYTFGSAFHKFEVNEHEREFHVYLNREVDESIIARFKDHWPGFKVFVVKIKEG